MNMCDYDMIKVTSTIGCLDGFMNIFLYAHGVEDLQV